LSLKLYRIGERNWKKEIKEKRNKGEKRYREEKLQIRKRLK
jgi:hypothetical protein